MPEVSSNNCAGKMARMSAPLDSPATPIANRSQFDCDSCHFQFSVTAGTIFHDSHLSLWKWFITTALLCESKKGMSACQIQRTVGMSYKTAWYLCHRIRRAMKQVEKPMLDGTVEMDETYVGGNSGRGRRPPTGKQRDRNWDWAAKRRTAIVSFQRRES